LDDIADGCEENWGKKGIVMMVKRKKTMVTMTTKVDSCVFASMELREQKKKQCRNRFFCMATGDQIVAVGVYHAA
jgi:hypothetical protein